MGKMQDASEKLQDLANDVKNEADQAGENLKNVANETVEKVEQATDDFKNEFDNHFNTSDEVANNADGMGQATEHDNQTGSEGQTDSEEHEDEGMNDHSGSVADETTE